MSRRRRSARREDSAEVNVTPMLDVVFILLIFFIVTSTFLDEQGIELIAPPSSENPPDAVPLPTILIQITAVDSILIQDRSGAQLTVGIDRVAANVQRQIVERGGQGAVVIRPHIDATHETVVRVYDQAQEAGAGGVIVREPEEF